MAPPAQDVDVLGNGRLIMRIVQPGKGTEPKPTKGQVVEVCIRALLVDGEDHLGLHRRSFRLGDGDECDALELVAPLLHPGDTCAVRSVPAAFNLEQGLCEARPSATTEAVVELLRVQSTPPVLESPLSARLAEAREKNDRGKWLFGRGEFQAAAYSFHLGLSYIAEACHEHAVQRQNGEGGEDSLTEENLGLCSFLWTNLALVQLRLPDDVQKAALSCEAALALQPKNVKAMYLKAKALLTPGLVTPQLRRDAIEVLTSALELDPRNELAQKLLDSANGDLVSEPLPAWSRLLLILTGVCIFAAAGGLCLPATGIFNTTMDVPGVGSMRADEM